MKVFGIAGWSGSGKTTLLVALIPVLAARGLRVSTLKHAHHSFDIDKPGKDSYEHRVAGATEVMISSANRWALMHEHRGAPEPRVEELTRHMSPVDLVLIEGFKRESHDKLEVHRPSLGKPLLAPEDSHVVAIACDTALDTALGTALDGAAVPVLALDDVDSIATFVIGHCGI